MIVPIKATPSARPTSVKCLEFVPVAALNPHTIMIVLTAL